jgi:receptor protein-tyrosine kinase
MSPTNPVESAKILPGPGITPAPDRSIGAILLDSGKIRPEDGERILRYAKEKGVRFGDAAIALKLATQDDIQQALARQFDYPYLLPGDSDVSPEVVAAWAPFSQQVEALRALRSQLVLRWFTGEPERKSLAVVSPSRGDGRSYLAANLAVVFSQMGERTLLIDADLRNARQHTLFNLPNASGLSTILSERAGLEVVQRIPAFADLSVLTAGPMPPNPLELLGRMNFAQTMAGLAHEYDVIIVDTPPAEQGSDYQLVAQKASGALMLARRNRTRVEACTALAEEVAAATATLVGSVLNDF